METFPPIVNPEAAVAVDVPINEKFPPIVVTPVIVFVPEPLRVRL